MVQNMRIAEVDIRRARVRIRIRASNPTRKKDTTRAIYSLLNDISTHI